MMDDLERKLLRIMCNFSVMRSRMPEIGELKIKTGRSLKDITTALTGLDQERYIRWDDKSRMDGIVILEDSERDGAMPPSPPIIANDVSYWTT